MRTALRTPVWTLLAVCFSLLAADQLLAAETHTGMIVAVGPHKITINAEGGSMQTFQVAADAEITLDDQPAKLEQLKPQQRVTVVAQREGTQFVAQIVKAFTNTP